MNYSLLIIFMLSALPTELMTQRAILVVRATVVVLQYVCSSVPYTGAHCDITNLLG